MVGVDWSAALIPLAAWGLDRLLGEPVRFHPLVGFGRWVDAVERCLYPRAGGPGRRFAAGLLAWCLLVVPPVAGAAWLQAALPALLAMAFAVLVLWLALGGKSLADHARAVEGPLAAGELDAARRAVAHLVSRDAARLDGTGVARAAVESVLENGSDAVVGSLFWHALAGPAGVVLHRLANTLDARFGYRSARYRHFGWIAARADDLLNWAPARLTALLYAASAPRPLSAWRCARRRARLWPSRNAGWAMAAGAAALGLRLGGPAPYAGALRRRPLLGRGRMPQAADIGRATRLVAQSGLAAALAAALWGAAA
ncbi:MAG: cobalamin biosynthesis protein CobD [Porticoccaceae bacterium]|nr:MAG: cobalamin biosynthesis protein CobD [Porticoccaceae bacterium]